MKAVIFDAAGPPLEPADVVRVSLDEGLRARGYAVTRYDLAALDVPPCNGDFGCWTVSPGICVQPGDHRAFPDLIAWSDLVVYLTQVTFGGYGWPLKRVLDHCIPVVLPLLRRVQGETHHPLRHRHRTSLLVIGLAARADPEAARVFERLAERNALNLSAEHFAAGVATPDLPDLRRWVNDRLGSLLASPAPRPGGEPLDLGAGQLPAIAPRRATLLVGSPRGGASTSMALARHMGAALEARGVTTSAIDLHRAFVSDPTIRQVVAALHETDVLVLLSPLYVDSLPAPVTRSLEILAPAVAQAGRRIRCLAIVNCGFPEARQADTALAIVRRFAAEAGMEWIGGLGICEGAAILARSRLAPSLARALEESAEAISLGAAIPPAARQLARRAPIPPWVFRRVVNWVFRRQARRHGVRLDGRRAYGPRRMSPRVHAEQGSEHRTHTPPAHA